MNEVASKVIAILLVEDNPGDARLVKETLRDAPGKFTINVAEKLNDGLTFLASQPVDVVLLDLRLPDSDGLETLTKLRSRFPHLPVVIMTGTGDEVIGTKAVELGAQDYLVKGQVESQLLSRSLTYAIQRKAAEEKLRQSEQRWATTLASIGDGVIATDTDGKITFMNGVVERLTGWPSNEASGKPISEVFKIINRDTRQPVENPVAIVLARGAVVSLANRTMLIKKDGSEIPIDDSGSPIRDKSGAITGVVLVFHDVTERQRAEAALRESQALQAANKELEAFAYAVSHDLRAPLRGIDGFSRILLQDYPDRLDEKGKNYLQRVRAAAQRMGELIDDILELSRASRNELKRERVNVSEIARKIAAELKKAEPERPVEFDIAEGMEAEGDRALINVAVENLINNAWKFSSKHARANIAFGVTGFEGVRTYFVRDDGCGFDMAYANKLFGPFQRLHSQDEFPGNGIGLATVQRIIHRHGGKVWAESEVDKGATFYFTLGNNNYREAR